AAPILNSITLGRSKNMSRCPRCNGCESQWDTNPCQWCAYPGEDTRSAEVIKEDDIEKKEFYEE
ncbi:MAG: hypothetical protein QQN63_12470, partial [Nitrosopumilus sp.]